MCQFGLVYGNRSPISTDVSDLGSICEVDETSVFVWQMEKALPDEVRADK